MKCWMGVFALSLAAIPLRADVAEDWASLSQANIGTYSDEQGSSINFQAVKGEKGEYVLELTYDLKANGWCGIWHTLGKDLSAAGSLVFSAKASPPGEIQIALHDKYNVQYVANVAIPSDRWSDVSVPLSAFQKNPYYQPPDAKQGNPMDLSETKNLNIAPATPGKGTFWIGPISWKKGSAAPPKVKTEAGSASEEKAASSKNASGKLTVQDFDKEESGVFGTYRDEQGSSIQAVYKENSKKKGDGVLMVQYELKTGGWCGIWHRAGNTWDGQNWSGAQAVEVGIYSKTPVQIGMAFQDANNVQYTSDGATTKGGKWEILRIPLSSFQKDPYYQPPEAKKDAPQDLSLVKTFNIAPKTPGKGSFAVDFIRIAR